MPPVSHPFKRGSLVILMNYKDHAPPHVHVKFQGDVGSFRIDIRTRQWLTSKRELPANLRSLVEVWVAAHEQELMEQWEKAQRGEAVEIVG